MSVSKLYNTESRLEITCNPLDGIIRFYLSGEESLTIKGKAFKDHPFWISQDDCCDRIAEKHESVSLTYDKIFTILRQMHSDDYVLLSFDLAHSRLPLHHRRSS
jgi:hypothetical protein